MRLIREYFTVCRSYYYSSIIYTVNPLTLSWMCIWSWMLSTPRLIPRACTLYFTRGNTEILMDWLIDWSGEWWLWTLSTPCLSPWACLVYLTGGNKDVLTNWSVLHILSKNSLSGRELSVERGQSLWRSVGGVRSVAKAMEQIGLSQDGQQCRVPGMDTYCYRRQQCSGECFVDCVRGETYR